MKIILENEIGKQSWEIMLAAYNKWERNHGYQLTDQMTWFFNDLYKEEVNEMVEKEVKARLIDLYGDGIEGYGILNITEEEYIKAGLPNNQDDLEEMEILREEIRDEISNIYYTFYVAPEKLTVVYLENGATPA